MSVTTNKAKPGFRSKSPGVDRQIVHFVGLIESRSLAYCQLVPHWTRKKRLGAILRPLPNGLGSVMRRNCPTDLLRSPFSRVGLTFETICDKISTNPNGTYVPF